MVRKLLKAAAAVGLGVLGAGVGRLAYVFIAGKGWVPDPKASPRLANFVADAFLVAGVIPGAAIGANIGNKVASAAHQK